MTGRSAAEQNPYTDGLSSAELDACKSLLDAMAPELGFDAGTIFEALRGGAPLDEALGLPKGAVDLIYAQAIARFNAGDTVSAMPLFQGLTALAPNVRDHWLGLGICLRIQDQLDLARVAFETSVILAPDTAAPRFHACELACQINAWALAKKHLAAFDAAADSSEKAQLAPDMRRLSALISTKAK